MLAVLAAIAFAIAALIAFTSLSGISVIGLGGARPVLRRLAPGVPGGCPVAAASLTMNDADLAEWERRFLEAHATGKVRVLDPLPWRVRLRLSVSRRIDHVGCWLVEHGHSGAAERLWRACRMW